MGEYRANMSMGNNYYEKADYSIAKEHYTEALRLSQNLDKKNEGAVCVSLGNIMYLQSDYAGALKSYLKALKLLGKASNKDVARALLNIGLVYSQLGNTEKGLEYFNRALSMQSALNNKSGVAQVSFQIAYLYNESLNNSTKALEYCTTARKIFEEIDDVNGFANATNYLGSLYRSVKNYELALAYMYTGLQLAEKKGFKRTSYTCLTSIGNTYMDIYRDSDFILGAANRINLTDSILLEKPIPNSRTGVLTEAEYCFKRALKICKETKELQELIYCYNWLSKIYEKQGNYKKSLAAHKLHTKHKNSFEEKKIKNVLQK